MENITTNDLALSAEAFDDSMAEYKKIYNRLNVKIKYYKDFDEFERNYFG
jgi:hypothetical protein